MTKIDQALAACHEDISAQPLFYDLFLNSLFFIPTINESKKENSDDGATPLLVEADGHSYLMLFDTIKRLTDWADEDAKYVALPGHAITEMSIQNLFWMLNYGTEQEKLFKPEEITWLKDVVHAAKEEDTDQQPDKQDEP